MHSTRSIMRPILNIYSALDFENFSHVVNLTLIWMDTENSNFVSVSKKSIMLPEILCFASPRADVALQKFKLVHKKLIFMEMVTELCTHRLEYCCTPSLKEWILMITLSVKVLHMVFSHWILFDASRSLIGCITKSLSSINIFGYSGRVV